MAREWEKVPLPTKAEWVKRFHLWDTIQSLTAVVVVLLFAFPLLRFTPTQVNALILVTAVIGGIFGPMISFFIHRCLRPVKDFLDGYHAGDLEEEDYTTAFEAVINLPLRFCTLMAGFWVFCGLAVIAGEHWSSDLFSVYSSVVMMASALTAGLASQIISYRLLKWQLAPIRDELAFALGNCELRSSLIKKIPIYKKVGISMVGLTLMALTFGVSLTQVRAEKTLNSMLVGQQAQVLEKIERVVSEQAIANFELSQMIDEGSEAFAEVFAVAETLGVELLLLRSAEDLDPAQIGGLHPEEAELIWDLREKAADELDSISFDTKNTFSWRFLGENGPVLVAMTSGDRVGGRLTAFRLDFFLLIALVIVLASLVSYLISTDLSKSITSLVKHASRVSSGDLTREHVFESDDELGDLARDVETMTNSVREMLSQVIHATGSVDQAATEISAVIGNVIDVSRVQVAGIEEAESSVSMITQQVTGIAQSAGVLGNSVEESSCSILQLGKGSDSLLATADSFAQSAETVSASIAEMFQSLKQISLNTEGLATAATETTVSMQEAVATVREIENTASVTSEIANDVVTTSETGHERVSETAKWMAEIQTATEGTQRVIERLGGRAEEIGNIINVINSVGDETNLLALNAAIIAAQAGEHGRAFAVVADEIKALAERVLGSTREIVSVVEAVQAESSGAVQSMQHSAGLVAAGGERSAQAGTSLEEITVSARESGDRMTQIVAAIQQQSEAVDHTMRMMEQVRDQVEQIQQAGEEQVRGAEWVRESGEEMSGFAMEMRTTTEEQADATREIQENVENVRVSTESINRALQEQQEACTQANIVLEGVTQKTKDNASSVTSLREAMKSLLDQADLLRLNLNRFRID